MIGISPCRTIPQPLVKEAAGSYYIWTISERFS